MKKEKKKEGSKFHSRTTRILKAKSCAFCVEKKEPDYKDFETLRRFISERGKIASRERSGICRKHQIKLSQAVKRARLLALLPFVARIK